MPHTMPLSTADKLEKLRQGAPGRYEFHLVQGESYETFEALMAEAKGLAHRHGGIWEIVDGTSARHESFIVTLLPPATIDENRHI
ncbi:hypothetical protein [Asticcacaulis sp. 201]|uniref:hypothetical protein n=1 Tax=Asticcacaulis sp. 201 TaxID=3028787 RepID=UPI002915D1D0|nr:hypothetical protein [Asticcacaulis sp. 201]MDV6332721.1 hypothetical protein [Asticcacaulis sp. 201]